MLAVWREWGFDTILKEAWEKGVVLAGISAGAIAGRARRYGLICRQLKVMDCMGFIRVARLISTVKSNGVRRWCCWRAGFGRGCSG